MILLIDNYDSFSYNLYQLIGSVYPDIRVIRNDDCTVEEIEAMQPAALILSPGPGRPEDAGICIPAIRYFAGKLPILGVCLGHQAICEAFGGTVTYAKQLMHGKQKQIRQTMENRIFAGMPETFACGKEGNASVGAGRYGRVRGRRSHGSRASERSDIWTAISSGIGHDAGRKENDRKFYKMCGKI